MNIMYHVDNECLLYLNVKISAIERFLSFDSSDDIYAAV